MKTKLLILFAALVSPLLINAQSAESYEGLSKSFPKAIKGSPQYNAKYHTISIALKDTFNAKTTKAKDTAKATAKAATKAVSKAKDSTKTTAKDSTVEIALASGTQLNNLSASSGIVIRIHFSDNLTGIISYNYGGVISKKQNLDSISLGSIVFPDINSSAFFGNLSYKFPWHSYSNGATDFIKLSGEGSYQAIAAQKTISTKKGDSVVSSKDSTYNFNVINGSIGASYGWTNKSNSFILLVGLHYDFAWIAINSEETFSQYYTNSPTQSPPAKNIQGLTGSVDAILSHKFDIFFKAFQSVNTAKQYQQLFSVGVKTVLSFTKF